MNIIPYYVQYNRLGKISEAGTSVGILRESWEVDFLGHFCLLFPKMMFTAPESLGKSFQGVFHVFFLYVPSSLVSIELVTTKTVTDFRCKQKISSRDDCLKLKLLQI